MLLGEKGPSPQEMGIQPEEMESDEEREARVEAKIPAIKKNPGETRSDEEIRKQAEQEVDEGVEVN